MLRMKKSSQMLFVVFKSGFLSTTDTRSKCLKY